MVRSMSDVKIGEIALLQIHRSPVKTSHRYDPAPLTPVAEASVDADGMLGWTGVGWVVDVHHAAWPNPGPRRPLSIGFTSHYDRMRSRYGDVALGAAGENIVVRADRVFRLDDLETRLTIRGENAELALTPTQVALPCLQFTSFLLGLPELGRRGELQDDLDFLGEGTRGFMVTVGEDVESTRVRVGDPVYLGS